MTLPLVCRIWFRPYEHFALWGWVINVTDERILIAAGASYLRFDGLRTAIEECSLRFFGPLFTSAQLDVIASDSVYVWYAGAVTPWSQLPTSLRGVPATSIDRDSMQSDAFCNMYVPRKAPEKSRNRHKRFCNTPNPSRMSPPERPVSPMLVEEEASGSAAYELRSIGGSEQDVMEAHAARPEWDQEVVEEILRHGAVPPLKEVRSVVERPQYREAECIFILPSGAETQPIFLPMSIVIAKYRSKVAQYIR